MALGQSYLQKEGEMGWEGKEGQRERDRERKEKKKRLGS
jgi:hypothetical protein